MFKEILKAITGKSLIVSMCEEFIKMLQTTHRMYEMTLPVFEGTQTVSKALGKEIHDIDVTVNQAERTIRKQILEHLSLGSVRDVPFCLILMSTTKDVERIGDFVKNLHETAEWLGEPLVVDSDTYGKELLEMLTDLNASFPNVIRAFRDSERELGHKVLRKEVAFSDRCDDMIERLVNDSLPTRRAVCYTLLARHVKRINAHLSNVASAVVMPLHKLDFFDEKWKKGERPPVQGE